MNKPLILASIIILILLGCGQGGVSNNNPKPDDLKKKYIVYEYYADWCGVCKRLTPNLKILEANYKGKIKVNRINIDRHQQLAREKGVRAIPTLILSDGVYDIAKSVGYMSYDELVNWIHKADKAR